MKTTQHTPGYEVKGEVFSVASNWRGYGRRLMKAHPDCDGYPAVRIYVNGQRKKVAVHRLVALHHLPPKPSPEHELRHIDGNKFNSCAS